MIIGEYEERAVYKCFNVVGNDPDSAIYVLISKYNGVFVVVMNHILFAHTWLVPVIPLQSSILTWGQGTTWQRRRFLQSEAFPLHFCLADRFQ